MVRDFQLAVVIFAPRATCVVSASIFGRDGVRTPDIR
jgi:hypothetical protein